MNTAAYCLRPDATMTQRCLAILHERIGTQRFNAWFKHGTRLAIENEHVRISVPNPFVASWIEKHYQGEIAAAANAVSPSTERRLLVTIDPSLTSELCKGQLDTQAQLVNRESSGTARPRHDTARAVPLRHHLEDFIVGASNKLAYSAAQLVAASGKAPFNPLFIHGPCGVGKTHLLQGICNAVANLHHAGRTPTWKYVTAEQFTNDYITAMRQKKWNEFRAAYRKLDLLAIDDVHFLSNKKSTQEEFLHTFNSLDTEGGQIVMASDAHPRMVGDLNEQLVSRFVAGMVVKLDAPDQATRMEILRRKSRTMKLHMPTEVLEYVAAHLRGSVRELEGALIKLMALATLANGTVTVAMASEALADHLARTDSALTLGDIEAAVAAFFGITPADIHSTRRTRTVSVARMIAMFLARRHTQMSYPEIGNFTGKNHSSVVLAVQRMEQILRKNGQVEWMTPAGTRKMAAGKLLELLVQQIS